jgi:hypothetical protein
MSNKKLVSFRLPDDLMQDLREKADADGISVTELVCRLLRQGLPSSGECRTGAVVDQRIASLETEIQEMRQTKQVNPVPPTPLYALLTQSAMQSECDLETKMRLTRLEGMIEKLMVHSGFQNARAGAD